MKVKEIPQAEGVRYVAMTNGDHALVCDDPARLDGIKPLAIMDVSRDGRRTWDPRGSAAGRRAILQHLEYDYDN